MLHNLLELTALKNYVFCLLITCILVVAFLPLFQVVHSQTQQPTIVLSPESYASTQLNDQFDITITVSNVQDLFGWDANISWNPNYLNLTQINNDGGLLASQTGDTFFLAPINVATGSCVVTEATTGTDTANGTGLLATLEFQVIARFS